MPINIRNSINTRFFKFKFEGEDGYFTIPQDVTDGSDTIQFSSNWTKQNLPGSTEPMVAFNYVDNPTININLKFHEDMFRDAGYNIGYNGEYRRVIGAFARMVYPSAKGAIITPPYVYIYMGQYVYRGYFTSIKINQYGIVRNGYKTSCDITGTFNIIKKTSPTQNGMFNFRVYFSTPRNEVDQINETLS